MSAARPALAEDGRRVVAWLCVVAIACALPWLLTPFHMRIAQQILLFAGLAVAWSMLGGLTQYWSFGNAAFVGLGAFAAALCEHWLDPALPGTARLAIGSGFAVFVAAVVSALVAVPILRLRGIYFAVAMLAVAEILGEASRNFDLFGGAMGLTLPAISVPGVNKIQLFYLLFLAYFVGCAIVFELTRRSRLGVGLACVGQDEDTAAMLGVPTERYKRIAFVLSAVMTTLGGVLYAHSLGFITSASVFRSEISFNLILYCMIGGLGTVAGPLIGTAVMIWITQVLLGELLDFHMMLTGALLITIVLAAPKGLLGWFKAVRANGGEQAAKVQS